MEDKKVYCIYLKGVFFHTVRMMTSKKTFNEVLQAYLDNGFQILMLDDKDPFVSTTWYTAKI